MTRAERPAEVGTVFDAVVVGAEAGSADDKHAFCAMYRAGLVGYVHYDRIRGASVQRFLRPGESTLETDSMLPRATRYLMHPVLSDVIGREFGTLHVFRPNRDTRFSKDKTPYKTAAAAVTDFSLAFVNSPAMFCTVP